MVYDLVKKLAGAPKNIVNNLSKNHKQKKLPKFNGTFLDVIYNLISTALDEELYKLLDLVFIQSEPNEDGEYEYKLTYLGLDSRKIDESYEITMYLLGDMDKKGKKVVRRIKTHSQRSVEKKVHGYAFQYDVDIEIKLDKVESMIRQPPICNNYLLLEQYAQATYNYLRNPDRDHCYAWHNGIDDITPIKEGLEKKIEELRHQG